MTKRCDKPAIDPGREEDGTVPRCEQPDLFAPYWPRILMIDGRADQACDPVGDGLTPEEWDAHEREQDRLQREHDRAMDERYA